MMLNWLKKLFPSNGGTQAIEQEDSIIYSPQMQQIHIWIGTCKSEDMLDSFFEEIYDEEDDDLPINKFATSQDVVFYDHDWVERSFSSNCSIRDLIHPHSYSVNYLEDALARASKFGIETANTFIMADVNDFNTPKTIKRKEMSLSYIGTFNCSP